MKAIHRKELSTADLYLITFKWLFTVCGSFDFGIGKATTVCAIISDSEPLNPAKLTNVISFMDMGDPKNRSKGEKMVMSANLRTKTAT